MRRGGPGAPGKTPFVAAVGTTPDGKPIRLKLGRVASACGASISGFARRSLHSSRERCAFRRACTVASDGLQYFARVADAGCDHQAIKTGSGPAAARVPAFKGANTALGTVKAAITGPCRAVAKHVPRCLAKFEHRSNRRHDLAAMIPRLCWAGVRTAPMPCRLLKSAEVHA